MTTQEAQLAAVPKSNGATFVDRMLAATLLRLIPETIRPNHVTGFRFLILPVVVYLIVTKDYAMGFLTFLIGALSDAVDGAMARTRDQITDWGKMYDPLADKLLVGATAVLLLTQFISKYVVASLILIEVLLILNAIYQIELKKRVIQAVFSGKVKMICQSAGVLLVFLFALYQSPILLSVANALLYVALFFGAVSLFVYRSI